MLNKIREKFSPIKLQKLIPQKGQSLVEMAIAAPLLLIMFLGVFEVGWALRGYIVLANVNRETTRFAVKSEVLDFSEENPATVGYNTVLSHTAASLAQQLPLEFKNNPNSTIIMSHFVADTRYPCVKYQGGKPKVPYEFDAANCDCNVDDPDDPQWFTDDDLVAYYDGPTGEYPHYAITYGISRTTRLGNGSYATLAKQLALENNQFNCNVLKTGSTGELSVNNMFIAEAFYDQPQLFGVPFISNRLTDPIPFYTHTAMRIVCSREGCTDSIGSTCEVFPLIFDEDKFPAPDAPTGNYPIDAFEGDGEGGFGWLNWDPGDNSNGYLVEEMHNPRLSMSDFTGLTPPPPPSGLQPDPSNDSLNVDDWVSGSTGVSTSSGVQAELEGLAGKTIRIPVYDVAYGTGSNKAYHISHFALIKIDQVCLPSNQCGQSLGLHGNDKAIFATFVRYDDAACSAGKSLDGPVAGNDNYTTDRETEITLNVLDNDSGDGIKIISVTDPDEGTISFTDTEITYTPYDHNHGVGTFVFVYTIQDSNGNTDMANVRVTVTEVGANTPPVADDKTVTTDKNVDVTITLTGSDSDGDSLTFRVVNPPSHGTLVGSPPNMTYRPDANYTGPDSFTYDAYDGAAYSAEATVSITVIGNHPPTADNKSVTTSEDTAVNITLTGSDADSDPLTFSVVSGPSNGTLSGTAPNLTYTPNPNWSGSDTFTYKANDGTADSAAATVTILVNPVNDPPVANNDSYNATQNIQLNGNVQDNDNDPDTIVLHTVLVSAPSKASSFTLNDDGSFSYTPNATGADSFTYRINDGTLDSNVATVNITIQAPLVLTTLASDNFASGNWSGGGGNPGWSGNWSVNNNLTDITFSQMRLRQYGEASRTVNMSGVTGASLSFQWRADSFEGGESAVVSINDGSGWTSVLTVNNGQDDNNNHTQTVDLSGYSMSSTFQIRFKINGSSDRDYFYIDNIEITGYK